MDLVLRMKTGGGERTLVWFDPEFQLYSIEWLNKSGHICDVEYDLSANDAALWMFVEEWGGKGDTPTKFYIRRAKAGIAIIDHAKERGL